MEIQVLPRYVQACLAADALPKAARAKLPVSAVEGCCTVAP